MAEVISRSIDNSEILVRFVFESDFKNKIVNENNFIDKDAFIDTRWPDISVSLQRRRYVDESGIKDIAEQNPNKFVGFVIFTKNKFNDSVTEHKITRNDFLAEIHSTPLDIELKVIPENIEVTTETKLYPAHADLIYQNPSVTKDDENANVAMRKFSRLLYKNCKLVIESKQEEGYSFFDILSA